MTETQPMRGFPPAPQDQVTLANWRTGPYNRWAFHHVRELVPSAPIRRGDGPVATLDRATADLGGVAFADTSGRETTLGEVLAATHTDAFLVMRRNTILFERYWNGMRADDPHILMSVSKSVTGALAGVLVECGQLDPDAPVTDYVPQAANGAYADATVRHLLDMTVGVRFEEDYVDPAGDVARYRVAMNWNPPADGTPVTDLRAFCAGLAPEGAHGERFHYVSPNTDMLGWVLERASGTRLADLLSACLWQPMGTEFDAYITVDGLGASRAAGGMCMTLRDLARLGRLMLDGGLSAGNQVIPAAWIDDIRRNGDTDAWRRGDFFETMPDTLYRSCWYVGAGAPGALCGIGIHGQWLWADPATDVVIAKFSSQPDPVDDPTDATLLRAFAAIAGRLADG